MRDHSQRHHFLPQSFLAGFSDSGKKDGWLYVFDLRKREVRRQRPATVAYEKHLHRLDLPGVKPDIVEQLVGMFECEAATATRKVVASLEMSEDDLELLLNLAALNAVRVPRFRRGMLAVAEAEADKPLSEAVLEQSFWDKLKCWFPERALGWSREEMEWAVSKAETDVARRRLWLFFSLFLAHDVLLKLLGQRAWSLYIAEEGKGHFICSDNPVSIIHSPPVVPARHPRLSERNTVVTMPLSRQVALIGRYSDVSHVADVGSKVIALVNFSTLSSAWHFLYGPRPDFICLAPDGGTMGVQGVFSLVRQERDHHSRRTH